MKAKTLKFTVILLIFASAFTACEKIDLLNIDTEAIYAYAEGGTFQIAVSSNGKWTAVVQDVENNSWITLDNTSGINDGVITVNIEKNPLFETRNATIQISMGNLSEYVRVEQEEAEEPCPCEDKEVFTLPFFVRDPFPQLEECGYLLFADFGSPGMFHNSFWWATSLPKEYQVRNLRVRATFCVLQERAPWPEQTFCIHPIIHIIEILKQCEQPFIQ